ncbi:MAG: nitrate reductase associated protein [Xenococcaceae cyanobacterium MO_188.B19]|nr:nitrate reductase associated protein [Xenococcaceae cyanobacterium MO_188.B19]
MNPSKINSQNFFEFETDFVESLNCIPMAVRMKLDTCGVKLKLSHWHQFNQQERIDLVNMPCLSTSEARTYKEFLQNLVQAKTGSLAGELTVPPHPPWLDAAKIPDRVQEKAKVFDVTISSEQWSALTPLQRFALIKLSRPSHENRNFLPALKEFNLYK